MVLQPSSSPGSRRAQTNAASIMLASLEAEVSDDEERNGQVEPPEDQGGAPKHAPGISRHVSHGSLDRTATLAGVAALTGQRHDSVSRSFEYAAGVRRTSLEQDLIWSSFSMNYSPDGFLPGTPPLTECLVRAVKLLAQLLLVTLSLFGLYCVWITIWYRSLLWTQLSSDNPGITSRAPVQLSGIKLVWAIMMLMIHIICVQSMPFFIVLFTVGREVIPLIRGIWFTTVVIANVVLWPIITIVFEIPQSGTNQIEQLTVMYTLVMMGNVVAISYRVGPLVLSHQEGTTWQKTKQFLATAFSAFILGLVVFAFGIAVFFSWFQSQGRSSDGFKTSIIALFTVIATITLMISIYRTTMVGTVHPGTLWIMLTPVYGSAVFVTRVMTSSLENLTSVVITSVLFGLFEVYGRSMIKHRVVAVSRATRMLSGQCSFPMSWKQEVITFAANARRNRLLADALILDMLAENMAILVSNLMIFLVRAFVIEQPVGDVLAEVGPVVGVQLAVELCTDFFSITYETGAGLALLAIWNMRKRDYLRGWGYIAFCATVLFIGYSRSLSIIRDNLE